MDLRDRRLRRELELHARHLIAVCALLSSCASPPPQPPTTSRSDAVTHGAVDAVDPAVVAIVAAPISCGDPLRVMCSGTLISPRVVLTAAHCTTALPAADVLVYFGTDVNDGNGVLVEIESAIADPDFAPPNDDVALLVLAEPAPVAPAQLRSAALAQSDVGATARVVGFGIDELGALGVKRSGTVSISQVGARDFVIGPAPAMSCEGDSGGPVFVTAATEEVAGITSFGDAQCVQSGTNMRVDAYRAGFIDPNVAASEAAPPAREPLDPSADSCARACTNDSDCPLGMGCTGKTCGFRGLPPGRFGPACSAGGSCANGMCLAAGVECRCYTPCAAPDGGCTSSSKQPGSAVWLWVIACVLWLHRRGAMMAASGSSQRLR